MLHKDKNGHAFKNIARRDAHNEFAHTRAAIGTHDDQFSVQISSFGEQKIVYQHLAQYRSDRLHIVTMPGNLIGNIKPRDVVQPVRIDSHTETNSARCRNGMGSCKARAASRLLFQAIKMRLPWPVNIPAGTTIVGRPKSITRRNANRRRRGAVEIGAARRPVDNSVRKRPGILLVSVTPPHIAVKENRV